MCEGSAYRCPVREKSRLEYQGSGGGNSGHLAQPSLSSPSQRPTSCYSNDFLVLCWPKTVSMPLEKQPDIKGAVIRGVGL